MNPTHSAGPWKLLGGNCGAMCGVMGPDGKAIFMLGQAKALKAADVAAVLALPELIKALDDAAALLGTAAHYCPNESIDERIEPKGEQLKTTGLADTCKAAAQAARAALAKANDLTALRVYLMRN